MTSKKDETYLLKKGKYIIFIIAFIINKVLSYR